MIVCESCGLVLMERLAYGDPLPEVLQGDESLEAYWTYGSALSPELPQQPIGLTGASNEVQLSRQLTPPPVQQMNKNVPGDLNAPYRVIQQLRDSWPVPEAPVSLAKKYFQQFSKKGVLKNTRFVRATETVVCAFLACRGSLQARTCQELKSLPGIAPNRIGKLIYKLKGLIKKKVMASNQPGSPATSLTDVAKAYCARFGAELHFCAALRVEETAKLLIDRAWPLIGHFHTNTVSAICLYMACHVLGEPRNFKEVGEESKVTTQTLQKAYTQLFPQIDELFDPTWENVDVSLLPNPRGRRGLGK
ncbi:hypothetical protein JX266_011493 [Neoarthrinium moseri]|nr:hypothetical protein JX266_011493 [Neoarthrinium moseri]